MAEAVVCTEGARTRVGDFSHSRLLTRSVRLLHQISNP